jgi:hypothetical protein
VTYDEQIAFIAGIKSGGKAQYRERRSGDEWDDCTNAPPWPDFSAYDYRIKPEPKVIWVNEYGGFFGLPFSTKDEAERNRRPGHTRTVRYIEAPEQE